MRLSSALAAGEGSRSRGVTSIRSRGVLGSVTSPTTVPSAMRIATGGQQRDADAVRDHLHEVRDRVDFAGDTALQPGAGAGLAAPGWRSCSRHRPAPFSARSARRRPARRPAPQCDPRARRCHRRGGAGGSVQRPRNLRLLAGVQRRPHGGDPDRRVRSRHRRDPRAAGPQERSRTRGHAGPGGRERKGRGRPNLMRMNSRLRLPAPCRPRRK